LDLLCGADNRRCITKKNPDGTLMLNANGQSQIELNIRGQVQFDAKAAGMSLTQFLETTKEGKSMSGPTGGIQGAVGTLFGTPYAAGSWQDKLIEAFSGTHDMGGGKLSGLYDAQGNIKRGMSDAERSAYDAWAAAAILPSAPFAAAELLPPEVWKAVAILLGAGK
jgi:filamentous hemagglutinin